MQAQTVSPPADRPPASEQPQQVVTFRVDGRTFGVDVAEVREIKGWQPATPLPNAARHVLGVINLRGQIIAVYDLRSLLGIREAEETRARVVLVVDVGERLCGIVADAVSDILDVSASDFRPSPTATGAHDVVTSLVVRGDAVIALLNVAAVTRELPVPPAN